MNNDTDLHANRRDEFVFQAPDEIYRILLLEVTRARGLQAFVRGRSRRRLWVRGEKADAAAVLKATNRMGFQLQVLQLKAVAEVMRKNDIPPSINLAKLVLLAEAKAAAASGRQPPPTTKDQTALSTSPQKLGVEIFVKPAASGRPCW